MSAKTPTPDDVVVGLRITALRKAKGLLLTQLGAAIGVTFQQIQKYENGTNRVSGNRLQGLARALEVPVAALFDEREVTLHDDAFAFLTEVGAVDLLKAYEAIECEQIRRDVLALVRVAARMYQGEKTKHRSKMTKSRRGEPGGAEAKSP